MVGYPLLLLSVSDTKWAGLAALSLAGMFGALGGSVAQAMVADLVAPERHRPRTPPCASPSNSAS